MCAFTNYCKRHVIFYVAHVTNHITYILAMRRKQKNSHDVQNKEQHRLQHVYILIRFSYRQALKLLAAW